MAPQFNAQSTAEELANYYSKDIQGKVILVTGVTTGGLGTYFAKCLANHGPKTLILMGRDPKKNQQSVDEVKQAAGPNVDVHSVELDLSDQNQIRKAAADVNGMYNKIDLVVNNAGVMACPYKLTKDGLEMQFGTNHIGHFLFTMLIIDKVLAAGAGARIVNIASDGHRFSGINWEDVNFAGGKSYNRWDAYGQSKTANMLFTISLAEKYGSKGLLSFSVHPGVIMTNLGRHNNEEDFMEITRIDKERGFRQGDQGLQVKTHSQGAATHVFASFERSLKEHNGAYLQDCQIAPQDEWQEVKPWAKDKDGAARLWELSEKIVGQKFGP